MSGWERPMRCSSWWPRLVALVVCALVTAPFASGCGHSHSDSYYTTTNGVATGFTLTLVNQTNLLLVPGPIVAEPGDEVLTSLPTLSPGSSEQIYFDFLPTSVTVSATATGGTTFVYPTHTLDLGIDYFSDATGATFIYQ